MECAGALRARPDRRSPRQPSLCPRIEVLAELTTARLRLRQWQDADLEPFAAMNADPEVMRHFPASLGRAESDALAARVGSAIAERGWGLWAVEVAGGARFIGFVGLNPPSFEAHFTP